MPSPSQEPQAGSSTLPQTGDETGEGSLPTLSAPQSLRDLLSASQGQGKTRRRSSAAASAKPSRRVAGASSEAAAALSPTRGSGDRSVSSPIGSPVASTGSRPGEGRQNGWHLWRQESADAKRMREATRNVNGSRLRSANASSSSGQQGVRLKMKRWSRRFYGSVRGMLSGEAYDDDEEDDSHMDESTDLFNDREEAVVASYDPEAPLSTLKLALLTVSLAGAQIAWTLELAYGTPFLLSLGLSKEGVSLVWLAGPASGLIVQPLIGALSDADMHSRFRRRKFMLLSALILSISTLVLAFGSPIAFFLVDIMGVGLGDWDPKRNAAAHKVTQFLCVTSFWVLDFALNGLQAASRALILDISPTHQQTSANAWQGIMTNVGSVIGYFAGWIDLASWAGLKWLGGGQFRRFAIFSIVSMGLCTALTCVSFTEHPEFNASRESQPIESQVMDAKLSATQKLRKITKDIWNTARRLPRPIRRICVTQCFNFCAWFGFLFYATQ